MSAVGRRRDGQRRRAHACEARPAEAPVRGLSPAVVLDFSFSPWTNPWRRTLGPPVRRCPGRPASVRPRVLRFASTIFQGARGASRRFLAPGSLHPGDLGVGGRGRRIREARRPSGCALGGGMCSQGLPPPAMAPKTGTPKVQPGCAALSTLYLASDVSALFPSYEQAVGVGVGPVAGGGEGGRLLTRRQHLAAHGAASAPPALPRTAGRGPGTPEAVGQAGPGRSLPHPLSPTPLPRARHARSWSPGFGRVAVGRFPASSTDVALQPFGVRFFRLCARATGTRPGRWRPPRGLPQSGAFRPPDVCRLWQVQTFVNYTSLCGANASSTLGAGLVQRTTRHKM